MPPRRGRPARALTEEQSEQPATPANAIEYLAGALWAFIYWKPSPQHVGAAYEGAEGGLQAGGRVAEQFLRLSPPSFTGEGNPEEVQYWIQGVERTFLLMECSERERVILATHVLQGVVGDWWRVAQQSSFPSRDVIEITWAEFSWSGSSSGTRRTASTVSSSALCRETSQ